MNALLFVRNGRKLVVDTHASDFKGLNRVLDRIDIQLHEVLGLIFPHQKAYFALVNMDTREDIMSGEVSCDVFKCKRYINNLSLPDGGEK